MQVDKVVSNNDNYDNKNPFKRDFFLRDFDDNLYEIAKKIPISIF